LTIYYLYSLTWSATKIIYERAKRSCFATTLSIWKLWKQYRP